MSKMTDRDELDQGVETVLLPLFPLRLVLFPGQVLPLHIFCLLYTSPSPRDRTRSRMPSSA